MTQFWLSFVDPTKSAPPGEQVPGGGGFLGVAIVEAHDFVDAVFEAYCQGVNPGGEVSGFALPVPLPDRYLNRLLTHLEASAIPDPNSKEEAMPQTPTIGRIVHYMLSNDDAESINRRRKDATNHMTEHRTRADGLQIHVGNDVRAGDQYPMIITQVWGAAGPIDTVNGQVFLDGNDLFWVTSIKEGDKPGTFRWPELTASR